MRRRILSAMQAGTVWVAVVALVAVSFIGTAGRLQAADPKVSVVAPGSELFGKSYEQWSAEWWKFVEAIPAYENPLLDATGAYSSVGQSGPVWFLVGTTGGAVTRQATIPADKYLLFPIMNVMCAIPNDGETKQAIRKCATSITDLFDVKTFSVSVDGVELEGVQSQRFRTASPIFYFDGASPNVYPGYEGTHEAVADGYYVILKPLSAGLHTVHFHGEAPAFGFTIDVTYELTIQS